MTYHPHISVDPISGRTRLTSQPDTTHQKEAEAKQAIRSPNQDWDAVFSEWQQSDLSQSSFCKQRGIKKSAFDYYRNKRISAQEKVRSKWVSVEVATPSTPPKTHSSDYQLLLSSGARLSIPQDYEKVTLAPLLKLLGACS